MATYYPSLSSQGDNFQTQYPVDQKQAFYSELPSYVTNMTIYNQPSAAGSYSELYPADCSLSSQNPAVEARNEMLFIPPTSNTIDWNGKLNTGAGTTVSGSLNGDPQAVHRTDHGVVDGEQNFQFQGLSLSLGTQMQAAAVSAPSLEQHFPSAFSAQLASGEHQNNLLSFLDHKSGHHNKEAYELSCYENSMLASKYLKAAQNLLDEVVSVRKALKKQKSNKSFDNSKDSEERPNNQSDHHESTAESSSELSQEERQDLQNKKTKLLSMLEEVDRRYKQYYHQMKTLESSFDIVAGHGAAKSYTALALQTISRHFRCLRDAISGQVEAIRKRTGEQDSLNSQIGIPRLRFVDHQLRQQRALQQLGVMQHAWRPQRGLPESSVSILRAWLFEHFLHPYPTETEKMKLAKQTGLTKNQVANWFINARVRLWKPMVEEMYKEEFGDSKTKSKSSFEEANYALGENNFAPENSREELQQDCVTSTAGEMNSSKDHSLLQNNSLDLKVTNSEIMKLNCEKRLDIDDHNLYPDEKFSRDLNADGRLISDSMAYGISEFNGFTVGNQVSLALGLQPRENEAFAMPSGTHVSGSNNITAEAMDYLCMNHGKQQDRFGNTHLLSDFAV